tara:strand:- start:251 stop:1795 length:1545 start_codon:yes stop_codon:yes gene_type:complete
MRRTVYDFQFSYHPVSSAHCDVLGSRMEILSAMNMSLKPGIGFLARHPMTALSVFALISVLLIAGQIHKVFTETGYRTALEAATSYSRSITDVREYYSSQIVPRVGEAGMTVSHDYRNLGSAIPLPATLTIEIGEISSSQRSGGEFRLFSSFPFPGRKSGGAQNELEAKVLQTLEGGNVEEFIAVEEVGDNSFLRYAIPVRMKKTCVDCHNSHDLSPRTDWKVGDVRGVQSVRLPMPGLSQAMTDTDFSMFIFIFVGVLGGLGVFSLLLRHLQDAIVQANQASQAKSDFLASMSHELRTPLNAIQGFSEMIAMKSFGPLGSTKYEEYADHIQSSSQHLLNLVNDVLDLASIEAGKMEIAREELAIEDIIKDSSRFIIGATGLDGIRYTVDVPEDLPPVYADKRALKQILINLLSNSVKFTPNGGLIALSVTASNGHHIFQVRDSGAGISEKRLKRITEPFFKEDGDPHKTQEGTGLGLAIVKSLVALHQGELIIESELGKGTMVSVSLPSGPAE